jgi:hypothetical protein
LNVTGLGSSGGELWLVADQGVAAWNTGSGTLRRFAMATNVPTPRALTIAGDRIFTLSGSSDLASLDAADVWQRFSVDLCGARPYDPTMSRLAGSRDALLLFNYGLLACDLRSNTWSRLDPRFNEASPFQGPGCISSIRPRKKPAANG